MFRDERTRQIRWFRAFLLIIMVELFLLGAVLAVKPVLRAIPGRYRARLPEPVQRLGDRPHGETLPTPMLVTTFALPTFPVTPPMATPIPASPTRTPVARAPTRGPPPSGVPTSTTTPTAVPTGTLTPTAVLDPELVARVTPSSLERALVTLPGVAHVYQLWNNCGPATLTMALSYYGWWGDQRDAAAYLKPNQEDKNVNPAEMVEFVRQQGLQAELRYGGDVQLVRQLLLAGFPVMVEKGFDPEPDRLGWMGHYLLIVGYNEFDRVFVTMDSYLGPDRKEPYADLDDYWKHFNRTYFLIYRLEQESEVAAVLGTNMDATVNLWNTLSVNIDEVRRDPEDAFAWFNLGTSYTQVGLFEDAAGSYDQARRLGLPWRMLWYQFGPFQAYLAVGRYEDVLALAEATLATTQEVEEAFYYKGVALQAKGNLTGARAEFQRAVEFNPNFMAGLQALAALPVGGD